MRRLERFHPGLARRRPPLPFAGLALLVVASLVQGAGGAGAAVADSAARAPAEGSQAPAVAQATTAPLSAPKLGGYLQVRQSWQEGAGFTMLLNRVRFSFDGSLPSRFSYRILTEWQAAAGARNPATVSLREAVIRWKPEPFTFTAGEFKTPFTREYLVPTSELELAALAVAVDSLAPRYDIGAMVEYSHGAAATLSLGVFNGDGANSTANRDSAVLVVGRATVRPLPQLSLGASGARDGRDSLRWGVDASVQHLGAVVRAEYLTRHRRGRDRGKDDFGWYLFESLRVTPRVQLLARQEDFQRPERGGARRVRGLAWGASVDVAPGRVRLLLELSRRVSGASQRRADTVLAQVQARF